MKHLLFLVSFLLLSFFSYSQEYNCPGCSPDSTTQLLALPLSGEERLQVLKTAVSTLGDFTKLLEVLNEIEKYDRKDLQKYHILKIGIESYLDGNKEKANEYFKKYINEQDKVKAVMGLESPLGLILFTFSSLEERLQYFSKKLKYYKSNGPYENLGACYHGLGGYYSRKGNYNTAIGYYLKSAEIFKKFSPFTYGNELAVVGNLYGSWGNSSKALFYSNQAIPILEKTNFYVTLCYSRISVAQLYKKQKEYDKAFTNLSENLKLIERVRSKVDINLPKLEVLTILEFGQIHLEKGEAKKSLPYLKKAEMIGDSINLKIKESYTPYEIDYAYYGYFNQLGDFATAESKLKDALKKAIEIEHEPLTKKYYKELSYFYDQRKDFENSKKYSLQYIQLSDSLTNANNKNIIAQYEMEQMDEEAQMQIALSQERRKSDQRNLIILGIFFLMITLGLYSRIRYIRKSRAIMQAERDRSESLLLNILPYEVAEELKANGKTVAKDFQKVSILFTDFKEFTQAAENMEAQHLVSEVNTCFEAFDHITDKYQIEKIKTIGDAYMAAGGLHTSSNESIKKTVLAALEMQEFIFNRKKKLESEGQVAFEMRVGIHTGPVVAGVVGVKKFQYDLWGDTVNIAARMETNGEVNQVNISQNTFQLLQEDSDFTFKNRGKIEVKGKGNMEMYFVQKK
jgi:class 3 adenylate cyclase